MEEEKEKKRFASHLKKQLIHINKNLFINPTDPLYYEKIIQYVDSSCPESHYKLGQKCEQAGNWPKAFYHYEKSTSRYSRYYHEAQQALERVKGCLKLPSPAVQAQAGRSKKSWLQKSLLTTLILFNILLILLFILFLTPAPLDAGSKDQTMGPVLNKPPPSPLTAIGANMVRTALQAYLLQHDQPPKHLKDLVQDYPNNYLSFIPVEAFSGLDHVVTLFDGTGGWVYNPKAEKISLMFYPNIPIGSDIPFEPVRILVWKKQHLLQIRNGSFLLAEKIVGLGKNDATPLGHFTISERVRNPSGTGKVPDIFGNAGLGLGKIAIHGTHDESSIGRNESLGCIRMSNEDIDSIYLFVPIGSSVTILTADAAEKQISPSLSLHDLLPEDFLQPKETAPGKVFSWLG